VPLDQRLPERVGVDQRAELGGECGQVGVPLQQVQVDPPLQAGQPPFLQPLRVGGEPAVGEAVRAAPPPPAAWEGDRIDDPAAAPDERCACRSRPGPQ
jgi:hypothetical protein